MFTEHCLGLKHFGSKLDPKIVFLKYFSNTICKTIQLCLYNYYKLFTVAANW